MKKVHKVLTAALLVLASAFLPLISTKNVSATQASAGISIHAGAGTYNYRGQARAYDDRAEFYINGTMWSHGSDINYDVNDGDTTVTFTFESLWVERYYGDIIINGTPYTVSNYLDFDNRTAWLNANQGRQVVSFDIPNVPKAADYDITVNHGDNNGTIWFANFLWTADPSQAAGPDYIGHSKLEFVKAQYEVNNTNYTVTSADTVGHMTPEGNFNTFQSADGYLRYGVMNNVNFDDGSLTLPGNCYITMRVVPEYGYQVTSVNGGTNFTTNDAGVSEFTMYVPEGTNGYFRATVEKVDDEVKANSSKVTSGSIQISNTELDAGTAQLFVDDAEPTAEKVAEFKDAAQGYNVQSYLDINFAKVLYKGTAADAWVEEIHHLENEATISLQLAEGIDGNEVVIVHNIDDEGEYEVIYPESFDPVTRIVTFKTKSFSGYAIATRTVSKPDSGVMMATTDGSSVTPNLAVVALASFFAITTALYVHRKNYTE